MKSFVSNYFLNRATNLAITRKKKINLLFIQSEILRYSFVCFCFCFVFLFFAKKKQLFYATTTISSHWSNSVDWSCGRDSCSVSSAWIPWLILIPLQGYNRFEFRVFFSPRLVALPKLKSLVCPITFSWMENSSQTLWEMQTASFRKWTRLAESTSLDNNRYATSVSINYIHSKITLIISSFCFVNVSRYQQNQISNWSIEIVKS